MKDEWNDLHLLICSCLPKQATRGFDPPQILFVGKFGILLEQDEESENDVIRLYISEMVQKRLNNIVYFVSERTTCGGRLYSVVCGGSADCACEREDIRLALEAVGDPRRAPTLAGKCWARPLMEALLR